MKKLYTLVASCLFIAGASGQITIGQWDVVQAGDQVDQARDTVPGALSSGASGASITWDFSTLTNDTLDQLTFTAPQWTPEGSNFPSANLAAEVGGGFYMYLINDGTGLRAVGQSGNPFGTGTINIPINPADEITRWPMSYQDSWMSTSVVDFTADGSAFGFDSVRNKSVTDRDYTVDGWGSVTTPLGTFDALRSYAMDITTDTSWVYAFGSWNMFNSSVDTSYNYTWWSNDPSTGFPLVEMEYDITADTAYSVSWLLSTPTASGVAENSKDELGIYPNPATNIVNVANIEGSGVVTILDMTGREVLENPVSSGMASINIEKLPEGAYILQWTSKDGTTQKQQQIVKE